MRPIACVLRASSGSPTGDRLPLRGPARRGATALSRHRDRRATRGGRRSLQPRPRSTQGSDPVGARRPPKASSRPSSWRIASMSRTAPSLKARLGRREATSPAQSSRAQVTRWRRQHPNAGDWPAQPRGVLRCEPGLPRTSIRGPMKPQPTRLLAPNSRQFKRGSCGFRRLTAVPRNHATLATNPPHPAQPCGKQHRKAKNSSGGPRNRTWRCGFGDHRVTDTPVPRGVAF
jgi:hypothetical protein